MKITYITDPCCRCGETSKVEVEERGLTAWTRCGVLIQDALPELTVDQRELMLSGIHHYCWLEMFGSEE